MKYNSQISMEKMNKVSKYSLFPAKYKKNDHSAEERK